MPLRIPMAGFRLNLVLKGLVPFAEDRIAALRIGEVTLRLVKPSTPCIVTSTDQLTGERSTNPLPALRRLRFGRPLMGVAFEGVLAPIAGSEGPLALSARCAAPGADDAPGV
jgi:uncharacterized protein